MAKCMNIPAQLTGWSKQLADRWGCAHEEGTAHLRIKIFIFKQLHYFQQSESNKQRVATIQFPC